MSKFVKPGSAGLSDESQPSSSMESTPEKQKLERATASVMQSSKNEKKNTCKRMQSEDEPGLGLVEPESGLLISHFGDLGRCYSANLDQNLKDTMNSSCSDKPMSQTERKYCGVPTSRGDVPYWVVRARQDATADDRKKEVPHELC